MRAAVDTAIQGGAGGEPRHFVTQFAFTLRINRDLGSELPPAAR
jgi:hypothetical protein